MMAWRESERRPRFRVFQTLNPITSWGWSKARVLNSANTYTWGRSRREGYTYSNPNSFSDATTNRGSYRDGAVNRNTPSEFTLFVENIPYHLQSNQVESLFNKFGRLTDIYIPRRPARKSGRRFGFIRFKHEHDAAKAAVNMNGRYVLNHKLFVDWARFHKQNTHHIHKARNHTQQHHQQRQQHQQQQNVAPKQVHQEKNKVWVPEVFLVEVTLLTRNMEFGLCIYPNTWCAIHVTQQNGGSLLLIRL